MVFPALFQSDGSAFCAALKGIFLAAAPYFAPAGFDIFPAAGTGARQERTAGTAIKAASRYQVSVRC